MANELSELLASLFDLVSPRGIVGKIVWGLLAVVLLGVLAIELLAALGY